MKTLLVLVAAVVLLGGCGAVSNRARVSAMQGELESTQFPYEVKLEENAVVAGSVNFHLETSEISRIAGVSYVDRDMFTVADETLDWLPTAGWEGVVTDCNDASGEVTAAFIFGTKRLGDWEAQITVSVNRHPREDVTVFGVLMDAPPAGEETLSPRDGEIDPCWRS